MGGNIMGGNSFFDESRESSQVKSTIVAKYFWAWAKVIIPTVKKGKDKKIAYIDLFAGPGCYNDGTKSTPIIVLERAIQDDDMREMLVTIFNDVNPEFAQSLKKAIDSIPNINLLNHYPSVSNNEVGDETVFKFERMHLIPTLLFVDPWGYKGLSCRLIGSVLKDWGCDCIFFFNYNRINMGIANQYVREHMNSLFGEERVESLASQLNGMLPNERELTIVENFAQSLKESVGNYVLPFRFKNDKGNRTSHHLFFVSKHIRGYEIMKDIMARESSNKIQGVSSFEYNPASQVQPLLFRLSQPLDALSDMLMSNFAGCKLRMIDIYNRHHVDTPYISSNYKAILARLEEEGKIITDPPASKRQKRNGKATFADDVMVSFPIN